HGDLDLGTEAQRVGDGAAGRRRQQPFARVFYRVPVQLHGHADLRDAQRVSRHAALQGDAEIGGVQAGQGRAAADLTQGAIGEGDEQQLDRRETDGLAIAADLTDVHLRTSPGRKYDPLAFEQLCLYSRHRFLLQRRAWPGRSGAVIIAPGERRAQPEPAGPGGSGAFLGEAVVAPRPQGLRVGGDDAYRAVGLEYRHLDVADLGDAVLPDGHEDVVAVQALAGQVLHHQLAVVHQQRRRPLDRSAEEGHPLSRYGYAEVDGDEHGGRDQSPRDRRVSADHRILHGVGDEQDHDEVEGRHLAQLPLSGRPQAQQEDEVDDDRASDD